MGAAGLPWPASLQPPEAVGRVGAAWTRAGGMTPRKWLALAAALMLMVQLWRAGWLGGERSACGRPYRAWQAGAAAALEELELEHLIIVPAHSVWLLVGVRTQGSAVDLEDERHWYLFDYQRGQVATYVAHVREAVRRGAADARSLIVFSGGETRAAVGPLSEGQSYYWAAHHARWFGENETDVARRAAAEEFARDSYENLLFSICRFRELAGRLPRRITVIGFGFKEYRFSDLHRWAIRFPAAHFAYVGIDPPDMSRAVIEGEFQNSVKPFSGDLYGCGPDLSAKRATRNPFGRHHGYLESCPELRDLLLYCGPSLYERDDMWP